MRSCAYACGSNLEYIDAENGLVVELGELLVRLALAAAAARLPLVQRLPVVQALQLFVQVRLDDVGPLK